MERYTKQYMDIKYPVSCPLMGRDISMDECFDIHMVVEGAAPKWTAPDKAVNTANFKDICRNCQFHRDD